MKKTTLYFIPRNWLFLNDRFSAKFDLYFSPNSREIGRFFREFVSENPKKWDFFPRPIRGPVLWTVYLIKVLYLVAFPPPNFLLHERQ